MKKIYSLLVLLSIFSSAVGQVSPYCSDTAYHFGNPAEIASAAIITVENISSNQMKVTVGSANTDPIDDLVIPGIAGSSISSIDTLPTGEYSRTISWASPPSAVSLQILWSKVSSPGNWQLVPGSGTLSVPFTANCSGTPAPTAQTSVYCNTTVLDFADTTTTQISAVNLSVGNIGPNEMKVVVSSANTDPVDDLIIAGGSGATISAIDNSVPGELSRTLTWTSPPVAAEMNILWSKASFAGNWQLVAGSGSDTLAFIDTCASVTPPPSVDITFMVNTANITVDPTGIFLAGGTSFGVPGTNPLTDANNDGIWEITVNRPVGFSGYYIFTNGSTTGWAAKENLAGLPCGDPNNFNDRSLPPVMSDTTLLFCYGTCATDTVCPSTPSNVDLTFSVNMSQYSGTFTTAYISGDFNGWSGTANPLTDQGNGIWQGTISVPENDSIEYKFTLDDWNVQESFSGGEPCTKTVGGFTNRFLTFGSSNVTVPGVCWNSCSACAVAPPSKAQIDLPISWDDSANVDYTVTDFDGAASSLSADPMNASNTVLQTIKNSSGQPWQGTTLSTPIGFANAIPFGQGSNTLRAHVYSPDSGITVRLKVEDNTAPPNTQFMEVDVTTSTANAWEVLDFDFNNPVGSNNTLTGATYTKAVIFYDFLNLPASTKTYYLDSLQFIGSTPPPPATVDISFSVDLSQYTGSFTAAYISGDFNGWSGTANPLTDQGNGIWQGTITLPENDSIEYKFTLDDWNVQENFNGGEPCTKTSGGFTNRFLTFGSSNVTVPGVCWNSCTACTITPPPAGSVSQYCNAQVFHFSNPAEVASEANLTIENVDSATVRFTISSANSDPVDDLVINTFSGGGVSALDTSVAGQLSRDLFWATNPPDSVFFNVLWSKVSSPGNWQLIAPAAAGGTDRDTILFADTCASTTPPPPAKAQIDLPISWDDSANVDYTVTDFDGAASSLAADPMNASNTVLQTIKNSSGQPWQGTTLSTPIGFANAIPFGQGSNTLRAHVYSPDSGITVRLKVEDNTAPPNTQFMEVDVTTSTANAWEVLDFDFNNPVGSNNTLTGATYIKAVIFYDFLNLPASTKTYYLDSLKFIGGSTTPPPPAKAQIDLPITWDDTANVDYSVGDFGGTSSMLAADPTNANNLVLMTTKDTSSGVQPWQGTTLSTPAGLANPIAFNSNSIMLRAHVYSPDSGIMVRLKVEDNSTPANFVEVDVPTTTSNAWEVLDFDFVNNAVNQNASVLDSTISYSKVSIFYDFGSINTKTYYVDSIQLLTGVVPPPPTKAQIDLPITWDDSANVNYAVLDYNGNASALVTDPMNPGNTVLSTTKTSGSQPWAGTTLGTSQGFANPIPFGAGNTTISAVIWSPDSGIQVRLKAEDQFLSSISVETEATTTVAGAWDTLYFDFTNNVFQTPALDTNETYELLTIFYDFNVAPSAPAKTYYIDDVFMGGPSVAPPPIYNVTFQVDLSDYTGPAYTSVGVFGSFNNWCGACNPMTDADGDSIYDVTIQTISDSMEYKFVLNAGAIDETLTQGSACTKTTSGFTNRFIVLTGDTTTPAVCWQSCSACTGSPVGPTTKNVTFQVDMNDYAGSYTDVAVFGSFNNWCGNCNIMSDANSDGIFDVTIPITADSIEYKFVVDNAVDQENFAGGEPCTKTAFGFTNRFTTLTGDTTLGDVCWNSCTQCTGVVVGGNVTFKVDMNDYATPFDTVYVGGNFNNWCASCAPMSDADGDGVWELTTFIGQDSIEFKYQVDEWDFEETFLGGESCTKTTSGFTNRFLEINGDTTLPELCWASCAACTGTPTTANIRFAVDMRLYPDTFSVAYVNGTFNGWCGKCNPLEDTDGDSLWEVTITLPVGDTIEFKYTLNGWDFEETLPLGAPCALTTGGFTNRYHIITGDHDFGNVCWESCFDCEPIGVENAMGIEYFDIMPNPSNGIFFMNYESVIDDKLEVSIYSITGQLVEQANFFGKVVREEIDLTNLQDGIYFFNLKNSKGVITKRVILSR